MAVTDSLDTAFKATLYPVNIDHVYRTVMFPGVRDKWCLDIMSIYLVAAGYSH